MPTNNNTDQFVGIVSLAVVGHKVQDISFLGEEISLVDALNQADLSLRGHSVRLVRGNNRTDIADPTGLMLRDGDKVFMIPQVRGGTE